MRMLILVALVVGITIFFLLHALPELADRRVKTFLKSYGIEALDRGETIWGLEETAIKHLMLAGEQQGWHFNLHMSGIRATYGWQTILEGKLLTLTIDQLTVDASQAPQLPPSSRAPTIDLDRLVATLSSVRLPLERIAIGQFDVNLSSREGCEIKAQGDQLVLSAVRRETSGYFRIDSCTSQGKAYGPIHIQAAGSSDIAWLPNLVFSVGNRESPPISGQISIEKSRQPLSKFPSGNFAVRFSTQLLGPQCLELIASTLPSHSFLNANFSKEIISQMAGKLSWSGSWFPPNRGADSLVEWLSRSWLISEFQLSGEATQSPWGAISFSLGGHLSGNLDKGRLTLAPLEVSGSLIGAPWERLRPWFSWPEPTALALHLEFPEPANWSTSKAGGFDFTAPSIHGRFVVSALQAPLIVVLQNGAIRARANHVSLSGESTIEASLQGRKLPLVELDTSALTDGKQASTRGAVRIPAWEGRGDWQGELGPGGLLSISGSSRIDNVAELLSTLEASLLVQQAFSIRRGSALLAFSAKRKASSNAEDLRIQHNIDFELQDAAGLLGSATFGGMNLSVKLENFGSGRWQSNQPAVFTIKNLTMGVPITQLRGELSLLGMSASNPSQWQLQSFGADVLGGHIDLEEPSIFSYPFSGNTFPMKLSNLRVDSILELYQEQGLSGSGALNGRVPLVLDKDGIHFDDARLSSPAPGGHIRYLGKSGAELGAAGKQLAMAVGLLENFLYDRLDINADFEPSGRMVLKLALLGHNPEYFEGRQVNFNINVEENLFDLFKALRLSDDISIKIEKRLKQKSLHPDE